MPGVYSLLSLHQFSEGMSEMYPESSFTVHVKARLVAPDPPKQYFPAIIQSSRGIFLEDEGVYVRMKLLNFPLKRGEEFPSVEVDEEAFEGRELRDNTGHLAVTGFEVYGRYNASTSFSFSVVSAMDHIPKGCGCYLGQESVYLTCEPPRFVGKKFVGGVSKKLQDFVASCCGCYYD